MPFVRLACARVSAYEIYLLLHVGAAVVWVGSAFLMVVLLTRASAARDAARMVALARDSEWLGLRLYLPANLVALVSAILLVQDGGFGWGRLWIVLGIAGFALSFAFGALVFAPGWQRVVRLSEADGPESTAVRAWMRRLLLVSRVDVGLLLGIVVVMVAKPASGDTGALALAAAMPVGAAAIALELARVELAGEECRAPTPERA